MNPIKLKKPVKKVTKNLSFEKKLQTLHYPPYTMTGKRAIELIEKDDLPSGSFLFRKDKTPYVMTLHYMKHDEESEGILAREIKLLWLRGGIIYNLGDMPLSSFTKDKRKEFSLTNLNWDLLDQCQKFKSVLDLLKKKNLTDYVRLISYKKNRKFQKTFKKIYENRSSRKK